MQTLRQENESLHRCLSWRAALGLRERCSRAFSGDLAIDPLFNSAALLGLETQTPREAQAPPLSEADRDSGMKSGSSESPSSSTCSLSHAASGAHQRRTGALAAAAAAAASAVRVVLAVELEMARFGAQLMAPGSERAAAWLPGARHSIGVLTVAAETSWPLLDEQVRARWRAALALLDPSGSLGLSEHALRAYSLASFVRDLSCFGTETVY